MELITDTSALLAVILGEQQKQHIITCTRNAILMAPESLTWEIDNAFSALMKRSRITLTQARQACEIFQSIPIRYIRPDISRTLEIAAKYNIYAYDAYFLESAERLSLPLITLDKQMIRIAEAMHISCIKVNP